MKRKHTLNDFNLVNHIELSRKTAIHEAGHAAAIYFGNKQKKLPPVFFQIIIGDCLCQSCDNCTTTVEGGRLIHTLPYSHEEVIRHFSDVQKQTYQQAFEADVVNLLVGSLAEANYVAQRDNELINSRLVPLNALHNYGGSSDLEIIDEYLQCFIIDSVQREKKIAELFRAAFAFINNCAHWYSISALANYILTSHKRVLSYEEVATLFETHSSVINQCAKLSSSHISRSLKCSECGLCLSMLATGS